MCIDFFTLAEARAVTSIYYYTIKSFFHCGTFSIYLKFHRQVGTLPYRWSVISRPAAAVLLADSRSARLMRAIVNVRDETHVFVFL